LPVCTDQVHYTGSALAAFDFYAPPITDCLRAGTGPADRRPCPPPGGRQLLTVSHVSPEDVLTALPAGSTTISLQISPFALRRGW